ncbi:MULTISPECIES: putative signal transducing protein [unclassified Nocardioides]|uniref:putative signal transducing protein n=1 Tax=unclassified Nocardioides TaxID=2615069 RepID=UPI0030148991
MSELIRTNDVALISVVEALLQDAGIPCHVADRHASLLEGSLNFLQMRVLVPDDREAEARELLTDADLGQWLKPGRSPAANGRPSPSADV